MLAISGAHFSYIILIVTWISKKLKNKKIEQISLIIAIIFFMNLTGNTPSVVRAGIMGIMLILANLLKRQYDFYTAICISLLIQIIQNPYVIFDIGLILSYSGVLGIVKFYDFFHSKLKSKVISVTLAANVLIIPIMIYKFNTISFTFIISNVLASALLGLIIMLEFLVSIIRIKSLFIILDILLSILSKIANFCANLPLSKVYVTTQTVYIVLAIYIFVYLFIKKRKYIPIFIVVILLFSIGLNFYSLQKDELIVNFIDVRTGR